VFDAVARNMLTEHWFYLTSDTLPLVPNWADVLDRNYRESLRRYLGCQSNLTRRFRDVSGVDRLDLGDPYILEAAVYPANVTKLEKNTARNHGTHHEVFRRFEMVKNSAITEQIANANWQENFRPRAGHVVVTRLAGSSIADNILGNEPQAGEDVLDVPQNEVTLEAPKRGRGRPRKETTQP
jgi:hypothetical protein